MINNENSARFLIGAILHDLAADAEAALHIAEALEGHATGFASGADPQRLREMAVLVRSAALALGMASASIVGVTERLRAIAAFVYVDESGGGDLPS